ncbi:hypothetical protein B5M42_015655 [Paenibacillus athensensis]|uniref:Helicase XPB/Ssl2 N-terminal domain-containing protein n=1 Tax=Paenibacillus athensensis TaxID=1967502 RepID=A0A4Y8Q8G9_9BACL|nr:hypothetical protein [Paenibacillus athensensis]MCD1260247.1 hypothetical protein [Paenibacillus athensensis]
MNLADMLCYSDIHELSRIALTYECECNGHSKNELIQSILNTVGRRDIFERYVRNLQVEDVRFLNSLLFDSRNSFSLEELTARAKQTRFQEKDDGGWNPRDTIGKFKRHGWLFNGYSQQTKYLFQVPEDLKRRFCDVLAAGFRERLAAGPEPEVYRDEQQLIVDDTLQFLRFIAQHGDIPLTAEGTMYKRQLQQVLDTMSVGEEMVAKGAWRFGYGRMFKEYPNRLSFIYDYCYYHRLIAESDRKLTLTEEGQARVAEGRKENNAQLYRFWLRLYKNPIPNLQSIVQWLERLTQGWVTAESLGGVLGELIKPFYYDTAQSIFEQRILQMMMHLGLLRIGEAERQAQVVRITKLGSEIIRGTYVAEEDKVTLAPGPQDVFDSSL